MGHLDTLDLVIFLAALVGILSFGMWVGRTQKPTDEQIDKDKPQAHCSKQSEIGHHADRRCHFLLSLSSQSGIGSSIPLFNSGALRSTWTVYVHTAHLATQTKHCRSLQ